MDYDPAGWLGRITIAALRAARASVDALPACNDRRAKPGYAPIANGCGAWVLDNGLARCVPFEPDFRNACNLHDICYGTFSGGTEADRGQCDADFLLRMLTECQNLDIFQRYFCVQSAWTFYWIVRTAGSAAFDNAQRSASICCDEPSPDFGCPNYIPVDPDPIPPVDPPPCVDCPPSD